MCTRDLLRRGSDATIREATRWLPHPLSSDSTLDGHQGFLERCPGNTLALAAAAVAKVEPEASEAEAMAVEVLHQTFASTGECAPETARLLECPRACTCTGPCRIRSKRRTPAYRRDMAVYRLEPLELSIRQGRAVESAAAS